MDYLERDHELRRPYLERPRCCACGEWSLKQSLVMDGAEELRSYPYLFLDEWEVVPGWSQCGKGDLVFTDGEGRFAVVEVKFIDRARTGKTVKTRRKNYRNKVWAQAREYAEALPRRHPELVVEVIGFAFTNELGPVPVHAVKVALAA